MAAFSHLLSYLHMAVYTPFLLILFFNVHYYCILIFLIFVLSLLHQRGSYGWFLLLFPLLRVSWCGMYLL